MQSYRTSLRVAFLHFSTNIDYCYVSANQTLFLVFFYITVCSLNCLYGVFDSVKIHLIAFFLLPISSFFFVEYIDVIFYFLILYFQIEYDYLDTSRNIVHYAGLVLFGWSPSFQN